MLVTYNESLKMWIFSYFKKLRLNNTLPPEFMKYPNINTLCKIRKVNLAYQLDDHLA